MSGQAQCRSCDRSITWVKLTTGKNHPVDPERRSEPRPGLVCLNPKTGRGKFLKAADLDDVRLWREAGATLHVSHYFTCPVLRQKREAEKAEAELERVTEKFPELG